MGGLKFSIPGFFGVGKFGKYFSFLVAWIQVGFFGGGGGGGGVGGIKKNLKISGSARVVVLLACISGAS